jgi:hypothetical protein
MEEKAMRDINDGVVNITQLVRTLDKKSGQIESVTVTAQRRVEFEYDGETGGVELIESAFEDALPADDVTVIED